MVDPVFSKLEKLVSYEDAAKCLLYNVETGEFTRISGPRKGQRVAYLNLHGYLRIKIGRRGFQAHRVAWLLVHREWPKTILDHRDGNRANNALSNLRPATPLQNSMNCKIPRNNTTGFKGVVDRGGKYLAFIKADKKQKYLGTFATKELAAAAYTAAAQEIFGEFERQSAGKAKP